RRPAERSLQGPGSGDGRGGVGVMSATALDVPNLHRLDFTLPTDLEAAVPPEARGITRDAVRMMVAYRGEQRLVHTTFFELPRFLDPGDLVVVNTSGTLAAAVDATAPDGTNLVVHLSTRLPADLRVVELRRDGVPWPE